MKRHYRHQALTTMEPPVVASRPTRSRVEEAIQCEPHAPKEGDHGELADRTVTRARRPRSSVAEGTSLSVMAAYRCRPKESSGTAAYSTQAVEKETTVTNWKSILGALLLLSGALD